MLESLKESRPEIAEELRHRTLLFDDLERLDVSALRTLLREVDLQTLILGLKGASESFRKKVLDNVTEGKAEIVMEELELNTALPGKASSDAQRKMVLIAKRLQREGQIVIPIVSESTASTRYGTGSLRSVLKLPPGLKIEEAETNFDVEKTSPNLKASDDNFADRIKRFMKGDTNSERYPSGKDQSPKKRPGEDK
jgi:hypothetical protein